MLEINDKILDRIRSDSVHRMSIDTAIVDSDDSPDMIPPELLHTLTPPGMPPHDLHLKVDGVYMLLRNMDIKQGLCNGTRFVVRDCSSPYVLKCELIPHDSAQEPKIFFLPRIETTPTEQYPFMFKRKQFPCLPAFAMTINKSQGGTFDCVGIDLTQPVFAHGQLYVALSRVRSFRSLHILLPNGTSTHNHVYREILDGTHQDVPNPPNRTQVQPDGHYHHEDDAHHDHQNPSNAPDSDLDNDYHSDNDQNHNPPPNPRQSLPNPPQPNIPSLSPPPIPAPLPVPSLDPWTLIDNLSTEQRMSIHDQVITHLAAAAPPPQTPPPRSQRPPPPPRAPPKPTRIQPYRKTKE